MFLLFCFDIPCICCKSNSFSLRSKPIIYLWYDWLVLALSSTGHVTTYSSGNKCCMACFRCTFPTFWLLAIWPYITSSISTTANIHRTGFSVFDFLLWSQLCQHWGIEFISFSSFVAVSEDQRTYSLIHRFHNACLHEDSCLSRSFLYDMFFQFRIISG